MRETLAQKFRRVAYANRGLCFDDVLTLMGIDRDAERARLKPRLYQMFERNECGLHDLLDQGIVVPSIGLTARCFRDFMGQAKEPVIPRQTNYPAVAEIQAIAAEGYVRDTTKDEALLLELQKSNLARQTLARVEDRVIDRMRRESDAHNFASGWKEAALAYKRLAGAESDTIIRPVLPSRPDQPKTH